MKKINLKVTRKAETPEEKRAVVISKFKAPKVKLLPKVEEKRLKNTLPPDTYQEEVEPLEMNITEHQSIVFSLKRSGDLGLLYIDIRQLVSSKKYTGFTKKGVSFPLEYISEAIEHLQEIKDECEREGLSNE